MNLSECANYLGMSCEEDIELGRWVVDSRLCEKNSLFVALPCDEESSFVALRTAKRDGHHFLEEASKRGAVAAIISNKYVGKEYGLKLLRVENPLKALQIVATKRRIAKKMIIIGITGSVGKTTIKEFSYALLKSHFRSDKTTKSYNGQIGLPLSIINTQDDSEVLILEMGMTHKGEMENLVQIAKPNIVVISIVGDVHCGFFQHPGEIAFEKGQILNSPFFERGWVHQMAYQFNEIKELSKNKIIEVFELDKEEYVFDRSNQTLTFLENKQILKLPFQEKHLVENLLPAILLARHFNISFQDIQQDILKIEPFEHRFQKWIFDDLMLIDDTYNNNPIAMRSVMNSLPKPSSGGRLIGVLGEMADLGEHSHTMHEEIGNEASFIFDQIFCFGPDTKVLQDAVLKKNKKAEYFSDKVSLIETLKKTIKEHDVVLIKGKNTNRLWEVVESLRDYYTLKIQP